MNRREFLTTITTGVLALREASAHVPAVSNLGCELWDVNPETSATLAISDPSNLRALQVTDIHFFMPSPRPRQDEKTIEDLSRLIDLTQPELLLLTGDLWQDNPQGRGEEFMRFGVEKINALGLPWLFVWGNHDKLDDYKTGHEAITNAPHSLYRGGPGGGNYTVHITDRAGKPCWDLICLNSNERGLGEAQHAWLASLREARLQQPVRPGAFALFHIPLKQYEDLWHAGTASGVCFEKIAHRNEDGVTLGFLQSLGTVRACFCGHDHINDFSCRFENMDLVYGRATGHAGYGANRVPKGAKIITVNCETGTYGWESILADGTRWHETPGVQITRYEDTPWGEKKSA